MNSSISAGPDPRVVRVSRAPRFIFVGVIALASDRERNDVAFWASLPSAVRVPDSHMTGDRSCLGLCLLQGWRARCCATVRSRHRIGSSASGTRLPPYRGHARFLSAPGLWANLPGHERASCELLATLASCQRSMLSPCRRPFSVFMGLMPGRSCRITRSDWIDSLSEVLHRP